MIRKIDSNKFSLTILKVTTFSRIRHTVIPVEIEGAPTDEETDDVEVPPQPASKPKKKKSKGGILITIQTTDGLFVKKGGLDYAGMKDLVSRLEGLC